MLNLRKRVKELQEKTSSLETKQVCKEVMENFINIPENQLASSLVEKLSNIKDADKYVEKFLTVTQKISDVTNLGVAKSLSELGSLRREIRESAVYNYPALTYNLNKIESAMNITKMPEYMVIDDLIECLKVFTWEPAIKGVYDLLKENREKHDESIVVARNIFTLANAKGSFMYESVVNKLEEHFANPTQSSRASIIEDLKKFNFNPEVRSLSESLKKLQGKNGSMQIIAENSKCEVSSVFSPVALYEGNEVLFVRGNFYSKKNNEISIISEEVKLLPDSYKELCRIVSSPNVFIKEGKVSFFLKRNKVEISENENSVDVFFNGSKVPTTDLAKHMVSTGMFRLDEAQTAYDVQRITESFKNIYELDFAKIIESKVYQGSYVILMKSGDNISLSKVNESVRSNEFYKNITVSQARNLILEFLGFDIKESMPEYISKEESKLNSLKETKIKISQSIAIVESQISKLETAEKEPALNGSLELKELRKILDSEISKLKENYSKISSEIVSFEKAINECEYEVGESVKINETGELASIVSIDSSRKTVTVVTSAGKSREIGVNKISSTKADLSHAAMDNSVEKKN